MAEIDKFASVLLEEAKRFFERAVEATDDDGKAAYLHAALMVGFASLEAHVNAVAEEVCERRGVSPHERAVLLEREMRLEDGMFVEKSLRIYRLEERLYLLHRRFGKGDFKKAAVMPSTMGTAIVLRNGLTHPKDASVIEAKDVKAALEAIIETIDRLYKAIFRRGLPAAARGLHSKLTF
jgi:hypothetical protein